MKNILYMLLFLFANQNVHSQENSTAITREVDGVFKVVEITKKKSLYIICVEKEGNKFALISSKKKLWRKAKKIVKGNEYFLRLRYSGYPAYDTMNYMDYKYVFNGVQIYPKEWFKFGFFIYETESLDGLYYLEEENKK